MTAAQRDRMVGRRVWLTVAALLALQATAMADHVSLVIDNHGGRPGAPERPRFILVPSYGQIGSPLIKTQACINSPRNGAVGHLAGPAFGHADPIKKDPLAVCGHGVAIIVDDERQTGQPPLEAGREATAPVLPSSEGASSAGAGPSSGAGLTQAAERILAILRQIDTPAGAAMPAVAQARADVHAQDAKSSAKDLPMPTAMTEQ